MKLLHGRSDPRLPPLSLRGLVHQGKSENDVQRGFGGWCYEGAPGTQRAVALNVSYPATLETDLREEDRAVHNAGRTSAEVHCKLLKLLPE